MQNAFVPGEGCSCSGGENVNPLAADHIVVAGDVCGERSCSPELEMCGCQLATIYFPNQQYRAGFCPNEAMAKGTLFPELVSNYQGGCC